MSKRGTSILTQELRQQNWSENEHPDSGCRNTGIQRKREDYFKRQIYVLLLLAPNCRSKRLPCLHNTYATVEANSLHRVGEDAIWGKIMVI